MAEELKTYPSSEKRVAAITLGVAKREYLDELAPGIRRELEDMLSRAAVELTRERGIPHKMTVMSVRPDDQAYIRGLDRTDFYVRDWPYALDTMLGLETYECSLVGRISPIYQPPAPMQEDDDA